VLSLNIVVLNLKPRNTEHITLVQIVFGNVSSVSVCHIENMWLEGRGKPPFSGMKRITVLLDES
jgi:hypothetical protein